ncbi:MAG TPA: 4Fe-4S dicluster domain-containing protein [Syntrophorhabdaceae bacterium]|nr:4Fe-4S dicluster domain-containing protein [Syntrophorhabdaceae bacterium]HPU29057.1 4Fe-4S dicluster domain-containing protein [Syntrophorhabdaceae bacterium]
MKRGKKIRINNDNCAGCMLCVLSCSFFNAGVFNPEKSIIKINKNDKTLKFTLKITVGCKMCGACVEACAYNALGWEDENTVN